MDRKDYLPWTKGVLVRVVFVEGKIKDVDSTWDSSPKELERIKEWKEGRILLKELKSSEIEKYKKVSKLSKRN